MVIIETSIFTRQVLALMDDDSYRRLQTVLVLRPDVGDVIPGSGGLRKIRWSAKGHGKRGGVRVIYYWVVKQDRILMLLMYWSPDSFSETAKRWLRRSKTDHTETTIGVRLWSRYAAKNAVTRPTNDRVQNFQVVGCNSCARIEMRISMNQFRSESIPPNRRVRSGLKGKLSSSTCGPD